MGKFVGVAQNVVNGNPKENLRKIEAHGMVFQFIVKYVVGDML